MSPVNKPLTSQSPHTETPLSLSSPLNHYSLSTLTSSYISHLRVRNCTENTVKNRQVYLSYFLRFCVDRDLFFLSQITEETIQSYKGHVSSLKNQRTNEPLSISSQRIRLSVIKNFFTYLQKQGLIPFHPFTHIEIPKSTPKEPRKATLTAEEVEEVLSQIDLKNPLGVRDRAMIEVLYSTAIRRMELASLGLYDLDMSEGLLRITQGKGQKERMVPIGKRAIKWTLKYLLEVRPYLIRWEDPGILFLSALGGGLSQNYLGTLVRGYLRQAGLLHGSCHLFRHTAATLMLAGGADMLSLQEMLGHNSLDTTVQYTRVGVEKLKEVFKQSHPRAFLDRGDE